MKLFHKSCEFTTFLLAYSGNQLIKPYENPNNKHWHIILTLKKVVLWLAFVNLVNFRWLTVKLQSGDVDIVQILAPKEDRTDPLQNSLHINSPKNDTSVIDSTLQEILTDIYQRNEKAHFQQKDETGITVKPIVELFTEKISLSLEEVFHYESTKRLENDTLERHVTPARVSTNTISQNLSNRFPWGYSKDNKEITQNFLTIVYTKLYPQTVNAQYALEQITRSYLYLVAARFGIFFLSLLTVILTAGIFCFPKLPMWHYIVLGSLFTVNLINLALSVVIIITREQLMKVIDYQSFLLLLEVMSILGFNIVFYVLHIVLLQNRVTSISELSSVYSEGEVENLGHFNKNDVSSSLHDFNELNTTKKLILDEKDISPTTPIIDYVLNREERRCVTEPIVDISDKPFMNGK